MANVRAADVSFKSWLVGNWEIGFVLAVIRQLTILRSWAHTETAALVRLTTKPMP